MTVLEEEKELGRNTQLHFGFHPMKLCISSVSLYTSFLLWLLPVTFTTEQSTSHASRFIKHPHDLNVWSGMISERLDTSHS